MNIEILLQEFEDFSNNFIDSLNCPSKKLKDAVKYSLLGGGKRARAQFIFILSDMFNISKNNAFCLAFAIEAIHAYSLVHDDLPAMDNDILRRGKPTCHIKFDEATAILAGDALQGLAFEVLQYLDIDCLKKFKLINKTLSQCSGFCGMVAGQQLDIDSENKEISFEELKIIHINKTAKMFYSSILLPFYLSEYNDIDIEKTLKELSLSFGLAFQIQDDILDITSNSKTLGKTANKDLNLNKSTYPALLGLEGAKLEFKQQNKNIKILIQKLNNKNLNISNLENFINRMIYRNY